MKTHKEFITEAKKLKFVRLYHGTTSDSAEKIKKSGFNSDEVYASTSKDIAKSFGSRYGGDTKVVSLRVPRKSIKNKAPANAIKTSGQRADNNWGGTHFTTVMRPEYATKSIVKEKPGVYYPPRVPKQYEKNLSSKSLMRSRTRTQPKRNEDF